MAVTVTVYRLEFPNGDGVYRHTEEKDSLWTQITGNFEDETLHPRPERDIPNWDDCFDCHWSFGFSSVEQYKNWVFNPFWRREFSRLGAVLSAYETPQHKTRRGRRQVIFLKSHAQKVDSYSPNHFG